MSREVTNTLFFNSNEFSFLGWSHLGAFKWIQHNRIESITVSIADTKIKEDNVQKQLCCFSFLLDCKILEYKGRILHISATNSARNIVDTWECL